MTRRPLAAQFWYALLWCFCWVVSQVWFRFRYTGRANVPKIGPVLLVANHQSHLDPLLVGVACPRQMSALARHSLFFWPLGPLIRSLGAVPIDRGRGGVAGFKATLALLRQGETVLVFPEGTRTTDGRLRTFHPGFCALARRSGAAIVPVAIHGAFDVLPRGSRFPRPKPISLVIRAAITSDRCSKLDDEQVVDLVLHEVQEGLRNARD